MELKYFDYYSKFINELYKKVDTSLEIKYIKSQFVEFDDDEKMLNFLKAKCLDLIHDYPQIYFAYGELGNTYISLGDFENARKAY